MHDAPLPNLASQYNSPRQQGSGWQAAAHMLTVENEAVGCGFWWRAGVESAGLERVPSALPPSSGQCRRIYMSKAAEPAQGFGSDLAAFEVEGQQTQAAWDSEGGDTMGKSDSVVDNPLAKGKGLADAAGSAMASGDWGEPEVLPSDDVFEEEQDEQEEEEESTVRERCQLNGLDGMPVAAHDLRRSTGLTRLHLPCSGRRRPGHHPDGCHTGVRPLCLLLHRHHHDRLHSELTAWLICGPPGALFHRRTAAVSALLRYRL